MLPYITTAEQDHILRQISTAQGSTTVKYLDKTVAIQTMLLDALSQLEAGHSIHIVCNDEPLTAITVELLHKMGVGDYVIRADAKTPIPDAAVANLRVHFKKKTQATRSTSDATYRLKFALADATAPYHNLHKQVINGSTIADIPLIMQRKGISQGVHDLNIQPVLAAAENLSYHQLLGKIHEAANGYKPLYKQLQRSDILHPSALQTLVNDGGYRDLVQKVKSLLAKCKVLHERYDTLVQKYTDRQKQALLQEQAIATSLLREKLLLVTSSAIGAPREASGVARLWKGKKPTDTSMQVHAMLQEVNTRLLQLNSDWEDYLSEDVTTANELVEYLEQLLKVHVSNGTPKQNLLRKLSLLNQEDKNWSDLNTELDTILLTINTAQVLTTTLENNSKSLWQQRRTVQTTYSLLHDLLDRLQTYKNYYLYIAAAAQEPLIQKICTCMQYIPTDEWRAAFDRAYFASEQSKATAAMLPQQGQNLDQLTQLAYDSLQERLKNIKAVLVARQQGIMPTIKAEHKLLFQSLIKKKLPMHSTVSELTANFGALSRELFPIQISSLAPDPSADCITYVLGQEYGNDCRLQLRAFDESDFGQEANEVSTYLPLYLNHYQYSQSISSLSNSDKIKAAKKLAKLLLAVNPNIKLYQAKEANIVSILPYQDDEVLEHILTERGAKAMHLDDMYLQLVESILADGRRQYIVIKDGLLSATDSDLLAWQVDIVQKYQSAGITAVSLYTADQLVHGLRHAVVKVADSIIPNQVTAEVQEVQTNPATEGTVTEPA